MARRRPRQLEVLTVAWLVSLRSVLAVAPVEEWPTVPVFQGGPGGEGTCFRIPTILSTRLGTLVAVAEERLDGCSDQSALNLVFKRSTDHGRTWGALSSAVLGGDQPTGNPNLAEVTLPNGMTALLLHFDTQNNPNPASHGRNMQLWSLDDGLTWESGSDITRFMPLSFAGCMPGPSIGVQAENGWIFFHCHMLVGGIDTALLYWSADMGRTWATSALIAGIDECSIALLPTGNIAMNCRTQKQARAQLLWGSDGSLIQGPYFPEGLLDPVCQGSMIAIGDMLLLSNNNATTRSCLTVKQSFDGGETWQRGVQVTSGPSGYSQLVDLGVVELDGHGAQNWVGVLYEIKPSIVFTFSKLADLDPRAHTQELLV